MENDQLNCEYFGLCGGCTFNERSLEVKRASIGLEVSEIIDASGLGRRRVSWHKKGSVFGFSKSKSHELVEIDHCKVIDPRLNEALPLARLIMDIMGDGDISVTLAANGLDFHVSVALPVNNKQRARLLLLPVEVTRLMVNNTLVSQQKVPLIGIAGLALPLPPNAFLQSTKLGEKLLQKEVLDHLGKAKHIVDLFAGLGTFTLELAKTHRVHAVELDENALKALTHGYHHSQGLKPITTEVRDLFTKPVFAKELNDYDLALLDPPRSGAPKQINEIAKSKLKKAIYVSCNPETFKRDMEVLINAGFKLTHLKAFDQFAFTRHVELVGVFTR